jgi:cation diffusion facilitator family transporter
MDRKKEIKKILIITFCLNLLVSIAKIIYGFKVNSVAIYSDGFHSLFDGINNIGGIIGIYLASRPPDKTHPYGHRKYETIFAVFIGVLMGLTSLEILKGTYESLIKAKKPELDEKAVVILLFTMCVNIFVYVYERKKGKELKSQFLIADSSHTKTDIFITSGIILTIIFIKSGFYFLDSIAGLIIGVFIAREAFKILKESTDILIDKALIDSSEIAQLVSTFKKVKACEDIRTRGTEGEIFVDLKILVDPSISIKEGHEIAEKVEKIIKKEFQDVADVVIHVEPYEKS